MIKVIKQGWRLWRALGKKLSTVYAYILYGIFYIILMLIPGIITRMFFDPLQMNENKAQKSSFSNWARPKETIEEAHTQF